MNEAAAARPMTGWKRWLIGTLVLLLIVTPFAFILIMNYGTVVGEEFAPDRFRRRTYHYFELPLVHIQLTPLKKQDRTNDLEKHLTGKKYIAPGARTPVRWDLVNVSRGDLPAPPGDAAILARYLDLTDEEGELVWLAWTKKQPKLAKVFWPAVAEAARREMYVLVPDLFHLAERESDPAKLEEQLDRRLSRKYEQAGRVEQQLGRHERAVDLFTAALDYDPDFAKAREGRQASLKAQGESPAPRQAS